MAAAAVLKAFQRFDADRSGSISRDELAEAGRLEMSLFYPFLLSGVERD